MIPAAFKYLRPRTVDEALSLLAQHGEDAKLLSGGQSLIPAMKLRLARPATIIDIGRIADLNYVREQPDHLALGAMTTHYAIESSALLAQRCPLLTELAPQIGDVQIRNRGTIGGSLAHADPAADWPAAILALDATLEIVGPNGSRLVPASEFFIDLFQTALQPNEILREIRVPATSQAVAYVKTAQRASGFAIAGVAVALDGAEAPRVGITGVAAKPFRAAAVESGLSGGLTKPRLIAAAHHAADGIDPLNDIHASAEFRAHLARVNTQRALENALARMTD